MHLCNVDVLRRIINGCVCTDQVVEWRTQRTKVAELFVVSFHLEDFHVSYAYVCHPCASVADREGIPAVLSNLIDCVNCGSCGTRDNPGLSDQGMEKEILFALRSIGLTSTKQLLQELLLAKERFEFAQNGMYMRRFFFLRS